MREKLTRLNVRRAAVTQVRDVVCGMVFEEETALEMGASRVEHAGRAYYFCCAVCAEDFRRDPDHYAESSA